jgi:uncharacterized protein YbcI
MQGTRVQGTSILADVSNALVRLHKEQFGRGPTLSRAHFGGPDVLVCVLEDVLLPAERKMVALGEQQRVRESRVAFQAATGSDFVAAVEQIVQRKVRAFASAIDPDNDVVFETFYFAQESGGDGDGALTAARASELGEDRRVGV